MHCALSEGQNCLMTIELGCSPNPCHPLHIWIRVLTLFLLLLQTGGRWHSHQPLQGVQAALCLLYVPEVTLSNLKKKNEAVHCTVYRWDHICSRYLIFTLKFGFQKPGGIIKLCSQGPKGFKIIQLSSLLQKLELSFLLISLPAPGQADAGQCCPCPLLSNHRRGFLRLPCINACCLVNSSSV